MCCVLFFFDPRPRICWFPVCWCFVVVVVFIHFWRKERENIDGAMGRWGASHMGPNQEVNAQPFGVQNDPPADWAPWPGLSQFLRNSKSSGVGALHVYIRNPTGLGRWALYWLAVGAKPRGHWIIWDLPLWSHGWSVFFCPTLWAAFLQALLFLQLNGFIINHRWCFLRRFLFTLRLYMKDSPKVQSLTFITVIIFGLTRLNAGVE